MSTIYFIALAQLSAWQVVIAALAAVAALVIYRITVALTKTDTPKDDGSHLPQTNHSIRYVARSRAVFKPGSGLRFLQVATSAGLVDIELSTQYLDGWGPVENGIVANITGSAQETDLKTATADPLTDLLSVLALSANAWVGTPVSVDAPSRETPEGKGLLHCSEEAYSVRELDDEATAGLLDRIGSHADALELRMALDCYQKALSACDSNHGLFALAQLHQGLTSISKIFVRFLEEDRGMTESDIWQMYGARGEELMDRVLQIELYHGDTRCLRAGRRAYESGGLEAQRKAADQSGELRDTAMGYLRSAILRLVNLDEIHRSRLLSLPYDSPLGEAGVSIPHLREEDSPNLAPRRLELWRFEAGPET